jgi:hypothetical protein
MRQILVAIFGVALFSIGVALFSEVVLRVFFVEDTRLYYSSQADETSTCLLVFVLLAEAAVDSLQSDETSTGLLVLFLLGEATVHCLKVDESSASLFMSCSHRLIDR